MGRMELFFLNINCIKMKPYLVFLFVLGLSLGANHSIQAQASSKKKEVVTDTCTVSGVCIMCKNRIENAALIPGVKFAEWDKDSGILTVIYRADKVSMDSIQKEIAQAGHNTTKFIAPDEVYEKLPPCCAYRDGREKH